MCLLADCRPDHDRNVAVRRKPSETGRWGENKSVPQREKGFTKPGDFGYLAAPFVAAAPFGSCARWHDDCFSTQATS
jgi:hypothetical protein